MRREKPGPLVFLQPLLFSDPEQWQKEERCGALAQAPPTRGAFGGVDGGGACECANRLADSHGADPQGGGSMEAGSADNAPYDSRKLFKDAGHKGSLSSDPSDFFFAELGKR